jgi:peroxiredoxin Q/BCP
VIIGISTDTIQDQEKFTAKEKLTFPLLADADKSAAKAYGVLSNDGKYAKRVTFVIDKQGTIRKVFPKVDIRKHPEEVLAFIKENLAGK